MKEISKKYGFITATAMIVGICIGSGIFFKSDNILIATGGSILWGVVLFVASAISIVFGCLTFGELASQTDQVGGLLSYSEEFLGSKAGCGYGWFQILVYYPSITAVVSWVIGIYTCILFGLPGTLGLQLLIGFAFLCICFTYNVLVPKFGAGVQNATTAIKLIPLLILAICGLIFGDPAAGFAAVDPRTVAGASILTALGPIAYSFDGWIVATSISHEVHDSRRNMPRALLFGPLIVLTMYVLYFVGVSCYVGPMEVIRLGDEHVSVAAERLLGAWFSKAIVAFVVVSVVGTVNGLVTGFIRMPYSIAVREGMFPMRKTLSKLDKHGMPAVSALMGFLLCTLWLCIHGLVTIKGWLPNSDVSEGAIVMSYLLYIPLYWRVFRLWKEGRVTSRFRGMVCPFLAIIGSFIILSGGLQNPMFIAFFLFCGAVVLAGILYYQAHHKKA